MNAILLQRSRQQDQMTKLVRSINDQKSHLCEDNTAAASGEPHTVVPDSLSRDGRNTEIFIVKQFIQGSKQISSHTPTLTPRCAPNGTADCIP